MLVPLLVLGGCATGGEAPDPISTLAESRAEGASDRRALEGECEAALLVAAALEACEAAQNFWQAGDMEAALDSLDLAYEMLLEIPDDASVVQQKADLRHLISRRVVEIYRSRLTTASDLDSAIPVEVNTHVERELARFRGPERRFFEESYRRSGQYRPMIVRKLREAGLPEELSWLPLVESGFKTRALSSARALGMWQFISSTGSRYGLRRSHWVDERMDPEKSTDAAIGYLTDLHGMFGDWTTALAGYNCGEHRVMREIRRQEADHLDHFWDLYGSLPRETARYVPRFMATLLIVRDPEKYGMELPEPLPPVDETRVALARHVRLADLDRALGLPKKTLEGLNPELRHGTTPADSYALKVPAQVAPAFETKLAALPAYVPPQETFARHRVRRGETLSTIARRYRSSVSAIARANNLRSLHRIRVGQSLKIPQRGGTRTVVAARSAPGTSWHHTVRRGDSLWSLASRYGTTVDRIRSDNGLRSDRLAVGQKLKIETGPAVAAGSRSYTVRRGDTIGRIARARNVSIDALLRVNGLSRSSTIYPGQVLRFPE
ncbi:MAG: LysM peptidoglycan-binding domain-containing protein [Myxococcota bacterium]